MDTIYARLPVDCSVVLRKAMTTRSKLSRRRFISSTSAAFGFTFLPSYLALGKKDSEGRVPPSQRMNLGCVGVGGRGTAVIKGLTSAGNAIPVALADVDSARSVEIATQFPKAKQFTDFRVMFDEMGDDIDAVSIATPDHTHFAIAMEAMRRGKHVYVEKPLTHTFHESELLMQAEKKYGVVTQMGNQGHTSGGASQFQQMVAGGVAKDIHKIEAFFRPFNHPGIWFYYDDKRIADYPKAEAIPDTLDWDLWCGPKEMKGFNSLYHPLRWRAFHLYGSGIFGDWGAHILDFAHDFLKLGLPTRVDALEMHDHGQVIFPTFSKLAMKFPARGEGMPELDLIWKDGFGCQPEVDEKYWDKPADGTAATHPKLRSIGATLMHRKDGKFVIHRSSHNAPSTLLPRVTMKEYLEVMKVPKVPDQHQESFVQACLGNGKTTSPFSISAELTQLLHLGITCQFLNESFDFDRKTKKIVGNAKAQAHLDGPEPRKGWEDYYTPIA